jgi:ABC-type enterochelin transport system substrate-binding protein
MVGDGHAVQSLSSNSNCSNHNSKKSKENNKKKKKKKRGGSKKKMSAEQTQALKSVSEWVLLDHSSSAVLDDFGVQQKTLVKPLVFELHSHSKCSDGFLSPAKLVERAHGNQVSFESISQMDFACCLLFLCFMLLFEVGFAF